MSDRKGFDLTCDVVVIGARCAGAASAMLMARAGLNVLVVDKRAYGSDTLSTHALMRGAVLQLDRWGLIDAVRASGAPAIRKTTFHYGAEAVEVDIRPQGRAEGLFAPRRYALDKLLVDAARDAGAEFLFGCHLVDLERNGAGRVTGAVIRNERGDTMRIGANLVVGADGAKSSVARLAAAPTIRSAQSSCGIIYGYWRGDRLGGSHWCYRCGSGSGAIPTNDGAVCVFAAVPQNRFRAVFQQDRAAGYERVIRWTAPWLADWVDAAEPCGTFQGFGGLPGFVRRPCGPGWALVGDAGYFKDPITAHGITDAFRDAELLALAAQTGTDGAFRTYQDLRDLLSLPLFDITDKIASFDWNLQDLAGLHQRLSAVMKAEAGVIAEIGNAFMRRYVQHAGQAGPLAA